MYWKIAGVSFNHFKMGGFASSLKGTNLSSVAFEIYAAFINHVQETLRHVQKTLRMTLKIELN